MHGQWVKRIAMTVAIMLAGDAAFAGQRAPGWTTNIDAGSSVRVTMKNNEAFDAILMGCDGDRAVFERFDPHETISVSLDAVRKVRIRKGASSPNAASMGVLGAVAGVLGALALIAVSLRGT